MRKIVLLLVVIVLMSHASTNIVSAQSVTQHKALILSSLERLVPMRTQDFRLIENALTRSGYSVTRVVDNSVTVNLLTTQLNSYDVLIWRTNTYTSGHRTYWYIGETRNAATAQVYASDFTSGRLDGSAGILGASADFFSKHFNSASLANVKLAILISSTSSSIAWFFLRAGVKSVIGVSDAFSLQFTIVDYLTGAILGFLARGYDVADSVSNTVMPLLNLRLEDPLDSMQVPSITYSGNFTLKIV